MASVYGADAYGCNTYQHDGSCTTAPGGGSGTGDGGRTTTQPSSPSIVPGVPNTSALAQPMVFIPTMLLVGVLIGTISFLITRKFRKNR